MSAIDKRNILMDDRSILMDDQRVVMRQQDDEGNRGGLTHAILHDSVRSVDFLIMKCVLLNPESATTDRRCRRPADSSVLQPNRRCRGVYQPDTESLNPVEVVETHRNHFLTDRSNGSGGGDGGGGNGRWCWRRYR